MSFRSGPAQTRSGYRPEFDGVRAIAIALVFWHHTGLLGVPRVGADFLGVDVFFVLSGYLITALLIDEHRAAGTVRIGDFYARRALRLLPALALLLVVAAVIVHAAGIRSEVAKFNASLPFVIAYAANWKMGSLGILTHTWSLAIEEQFYLLWPPVLLLAFSRSISRRTLAISLAIFVLVLAVISARWGSVPAQSISRLGDVIVQTYTRAIAIALGCIVALLPDLSRRAHDRLVGWVGLGGAVAVFIVRKNPSTFHFQIGYVAFAFFTAVVIANVVHAPDGPIARGLRFGPLVKVGRISYGLYLFHVPVILFLRWERPVPFGLASLVVALAATFALALWSYWIVERPALRLQTRFRRGGATDQITRASTAE